jgi:CubicO group peptidase (beta-lactamase class C family)
MGTAGWLPGAGRGLIMGMAALLMATLAAPAMGVQAGLPRGTPEALGMSSERLGRLTRTLERFVAQGELVGAVALIARDGRAVYVEAVGQRDREAGSPMRTDAIFRIASQTKALVSVAAMMLQEDGALLITDPVGRYLPEYTATTVAVPREAGGYDVVAARRPVTIRDLLTHTAGVGYGNGPGEDRWEAAGIQGWYLADRDEPIGETVSRIASLPFLAQPGEAFVYGYSTDILGALVEKVSGLSLEAFLRERIFEPLGMKDTRFYLDASDRERLATVYSRTPAGSLDRAPAPGGMIGQGMYADGPRRSFSGGAGLLSTAADYARFLQMLLNGDELDGVRVLSPKTVELMTVDHVGDRYTQPGVGFGLGFSVVTDVGARGIPGSPGEFGWGGAYHSTYWIDPVEALVVVYFTQLIPAGRVNDHGTLRALVYQAIVDSRSR